MIAHRPIRPASGPKKKTVWTDTSHCREQNMISEGLNHIIHISVRKGTLWGDRNASNYLTYI